MSKTTLDGELVDPNKEFLVTKEFEGYIKTGGKPSNSYYGAAQLIEPIYEEIQVQKGIKIKINHRGAFLEKDGVDFPFRTEKYRFTPFEKNHSGSKPTTVKLLSEYVEPIHP